MSYLLSQIWICLLLTALVAGLAGWLLGSGGKRKIKQLEDKWRTKLARAENERDYYSGEVKNLSAIAVEREEMEERFVVEKQSLENELDALQKGMKFKVDSSKEQEEKLSLKAHDLEEENTSLSAKVEEEQQVFTQRLAELEASAELSKSQAEDYEDKVTSLQSELDDAHINLTDMTNRLTESEAKLNSGSSSGFAKAATASTAALAGVAAATSFGNSDSTTSTTTDSIIDPTANDYPVDVIEALSDDDNRRLRKLGIKTTTGLLQKASNKEAISLLAKSLGKESWVVRSWASVADLLRVENVDAVEAELLELAGVATVQSLSRSNADKLVDSIKVIHRHVGKTTEAPNSVAIGGWIQNATRLEPMLETNVDKL
ncbi:MAG: DUF4332 domain-containing protein [Thiotrichaceae bacterium]